MRHLFLHFSSHTLTRICSCLHYEVAHVRNIMEFFLKKPEILCYVMQSVFVGEYEDHPKGTSIVSTLLGERTGPATARDISFVSSVQTESGTHPSSCPIGKGSLTRE